MAAGVQDRPIGHVQGAQRLVVHVPVGAVRCHIDGLPKAHRPRPVHRDRAMFANRPVLTGHIQPAVETHRRRAPRANRQLHILPAFVGHLQVVLKRHHAIGRRARQWQSVGPHRVQRQISVVRSRGTSTQVQVPRRVHLPGAPRRVQVAAEGQPTRHIQLRGPGQRQVHIRQGLPMVPPQK